MTPKFRVWLEETKEMRTVTALWFDDLGNLFEIASINKPEKFPCIDTINDDMKLMQSTGLTDCKGKEIYEGDIVFWQWGQLDDIDIGIGNNVFTNCGKKIVDSDLHTLVMLEEADRLLVLGNIYENPELIKEAQG